MYWHETGQQPVFHVFNGTDNVGRFSRIGKTKWFQQYMMIDSDIIPALMALTVESDLAQEVKDTFVNFVCILYCPKGIYITSIPLFHSIKNEKVFSRDPKWYFLGGLKDLGFQKTYIL